MPDPFRWARRTAAQAIDVLANLTMTSTVYGALKVWFGVQRLKKRKLTHGEKELMWKYFKDVDLDEVRLGLGATLPAPKNKRAMVLGHTIYWEDKKLRICDEESGPDDARLLMHELVHVRQAEDSGGALLFLSCYLYEATMYEPLPGGQPGERPSYEAEASRFTNIKGSGMERRRAAICEVQPDSRYYRAPPDDWSWLLFG